MAGSALTPPDLRASFEYAHHCNDVDDRGHSGRCAASHKNRRCPLDPSVCWGDND